MSDKEKKTLPLHTQRKHPRHGLHINIISDPFQHRIPSHLQKFWQESQVRQRLQSAEIQFRKAYKRATPKQRIVLHVCAILFVIYWVYVVASVWRSPGRHRPPPMQDLGLPEVDLLDDIYPMDGKGQTTAILLNWSRLENMKLIVKQLCRYDMFKNVMIWNNNQEVVLTEEMFATSACPRSKLLIYNSPGNMHFIARYMACAAASTPYCYFQDDDWIIPALRSMYANFLRFPQFIHTDTNADVYSLTNWKWCFFNDNVNLHACFSWVGTGAFVSRENVVRFLKLASLTGMDPTEFAFGDMYFTTYMNQVPYQLENTLHELPQENAFSAGNGRIRNKIYMHKALQRLFANLEQDNGIFQTEELSPTLYQRDVRSPCHNDRCLFLANKHSFPDVRLFHYQPHVNISESEDHHDDQFDSQPFIHHPYSRAVDGDDGSAWISLADIQSGDYIGLDLLRAMPVPVTYRLLLAHDRTYFDDLEVQISFDGQDWISLEAELKCRERYDTATRKRYRDCGFQILEIGYRFIRLLSHSPLDYGYAVHDFAFHAKVKHGSKIVHNDQEDGAEEYERARYIHVKFLDP